MRDLSITLEQALALRDRGALLVDARSPAEFAAATIPGAINVPVFDDEERHRVGLCYAEEGKRQARRLGVDLVSPKIPRMIATVEEALAGGRPPVIVFCWRGGMRSRSLATFLELAGFPVRQLTGGHKAFRSHVCRFFADEEWGRLLVLRGLTGVGKTRLLQKLERDGYPVIDLEGLANHRGSAFGALGLPRQPSQKMFEALLWDRLRQIPTDGYALTEGESKHIGRVVLPERVYAALQVETSLWIEASLAYRVRVILDDYPARDQLRDQFAVPIRALKERLGRERIEELLALLDAGEWEELTARLMVDYYDPLYRHTRPDRRIEIAMEPEERGMEHLKRAIAAILAVEPGEPVSL
ncbi:tRNA 2-selenouridine(34) synthase MnmH [Geothermobacter hydrogeniphilus]|uniref:tRNA 2-selenouridine(34) synthase MnmH n=1 Tax=Geothermobacter hydrogeniphilus TaxID=1969733 RepID=A0A1X0XPR0_9BACT|nr:tRNA 2-selenouridine(34) synthase MnmH [Geothermobacter hydrogeniphilus]ORJ54899.1 tRNA 2-selenouridine(34) synthase MnmH [Geothermobacter hydrogeniphilus]